MRCDPVPGRIFTSERLLWALAVVIGIELLVSQVISWEVSVWVAMCGDGLLALGTLGLFLARIYRNREVDWLLLFVAVMMVLLAANHWEIAQSHPIAGIRPVVSLTPSRRNLQKARRFGVRGESLFFIFRCPYRKC